ncbi:glycerate kinase [Sporolactobacillus sp. Y61]|uniref:Glycerate kinase n=1 Tax=Sporolactobacillus sp. Y61 TaxID=3160863 RepID=A0AAU8IBN1_9BACL
MKMVIAPDSFKESLTALDAARSIQRGMKRIFSDADYVLVPMADGGEGTVQSLVDATGGKRLNLTVTGPLGAPVPGFFGLLGDGQTAVIEMAAAAGLEFLPPSSRDPLRATTYGVGELIRAAMDHGARHIIMGLGGSATNDGGCGMAQALGARLLDAAGRQIPPGGAALSRLSRIDLSSVDPRVHSTRFEIATDVTNPLTGRNGASAVFGPQKGADASAVTRLDQALARFAEVVAHDLNIAVDQVPGAGAAGGLGAGCLAFLKGQIRPGIDLVIRETGLEKKLKDADLVLTGEGKIDGQTIYGKTPVGVARAAKRHHIPVIGVAGALSAGYEAVYAAGIDALFSIVPGAVPLKQALAEAGANLERTGENIARLIQLTGGMKKN